MMKELAIQFELLHSVDLLLILRGVICGLRDQAFEFVIFISALDLVDTTLRIRLGHSNYF